MDQLGDEDLLQEEMEDRDVSHPGDPRAAAWAELGEAFFNNPRSQNDRTELPSNLSTTPIIAAGSIEGADRLMVEVRNPDTGQADYLGEVPLTITPSQVIKRYWKSCPQKPGEPSAEFYFKALDKTGSKIGTATKPDGHLSVAYTNPLLEKIREEEAAKAKLAQDPDGGLAFRIMQTQLEREREERIEALRRAEENAKHLREMEQAILKDRLEHAKAMQMDIGVAYERVGSTQEKGFQAIMTASERMSLEREKREEERRQKEQADEEKRRQRELDRYEEDRKRREEERKEERERLRAENAANLERVKAENAAALERVKAEAEARRLEIQAAAQLERDRIAAEVEKAKLAAEAERIRVQEERREQEQRRREEQERRDKLDAAERERSREFSIAMEKIRTDSLTAAEKRLDAEGVRQAEHTRLVIDMLKERNNPTGHKLGVVGDLLEMTGMSVSDLIEKGKDLLGGAGGASPAIAIIEGVSGAVKEFIKRMPVMDEGEEVDDEDEEDVEEEVAPPPKRRIVKRTPAQIEQQETLPVLREAPLPDALPATVAANFGGEPAANDAAAAIPLAERRDGRAAVESLVQRLEGAGEDRWAEVVMQGTDVDALVRYLGTVGLRRALDGYDVNVDRLGAVLVELGLFEKVPMDPTAPDHSSQEDASPSGSGKIPETTPAYTVPQKGAPLYKKDGDK